MKDETLIVIPFRFTKAFRRAIGRRIGKRGPATDDEVIAWAEMCLEASCEGLVEEMVERRMNRR